MRLVLFLALLGSSVYFVFFSNVFKISEVIVEGGNLLPSETIASTVPRGLNIFRLHAAKLKQDLLIQFPEINDLEIYRGIPNAIKIVVQEKDARVLWQSGENKYIINSNGEAIRKVAAGDESKIGTPPLIIDKKNITAEPGLILVSPNFVSFITNVYSQFFDATNIKPTFFEVEETTFDVVLHTEAGFYVKLNTMRSSKKQLDNLKKVLVEKRGDVHEYVDLRIDGWAYYK
ncbi:MAG: FtsQ-type POTRA domain-containing protein [Patescibacteria group bacterium]|jgi:hypothetical protein